jgi:hypothetical protein
VKRLRPGRFEPGLALEVCTQSRDDVGFRYFAGQIDCVHAARW